MLGCCQASSLCCHVCLGECCWETLLHAVGAVGVRLLLWLKGHQGGLVACINNNSC